MELKHADSSIKKKFQMQQSAEKVMLTVFWDTKGASTIDFHRKGGTVKSVFYIYIYIYIYIYAPPHELSTFVGKFAG